MTSFLEAADVSIEYRTGFGLRDFSLKAEAGQLIAVAGPNGAGKSTLLRILAGDATPTTGLIRLSGRPLGDIAAHERALLRSYLTQQPSGEIPFTVRDVVAMGRYPHRRREGNTRHSDDVAVEAALAATDVESISHRIVATLSGGEAQRTHVARLLAQQTPLLLLDEPTAALDIAHQELVMANLRRVATGGGAVVAVVHDLNLGAVFADRLVLLSGGSTAAIGSPRAVLTESRLSDVYDHPVRVIDHPFRDAPLVLTGDG